MKLSLKLKRYKLIEEHRYLIRSGKLQEARQILRFLSTGYVRLGFDDVSWKVEQVLESCGFHISVNPRSGMASCSVDWSYKN